MPRTYSDDDAQWIFEETGAVPRGFVSRLSDREKAYHRIEIPNSMFGPPARADSIATGLIPRAHVPSEIEKSYSRVNDPNSPYGPPTQADFVLLGLYPRATSPKHLTETQQLAQETAGRQLRVNTGTTTSADTLAVKSTAEWEEMSKGLLPTKPLPTKPPPARQVDKAGVEFTDRIKKDQGLLGTGGTSFFGNAGQLQEGTPGFDLAQSRVAANSDSAQMVINAKNLGHTSFDGTPDSFLPMKKEFEGTLREYRAIKNKKGAGGGKGAADKWLSDNSGGMIDIDNLIGIVRKYNEGLLKESK